MMELFIKIIGDLGFSRVNATIRAAIFCIIFGLPSAWSLDFFTNQDWVWGLGLVVSGLFITFAVLKYGVQEFKTSFSKPDSDFTVSIVFKYGIHIFKSTFIDQDSDFIVNRWYYAIAMFLNMGLGLVLIIWWMSQEFTKTGGWIYNNWLTLAEWAALILAGILLNRWLYKKFCS